MMNTELIEVAGLSIELVRKQIKNLHIGVYPPSGRVRVAAPPVVSEDAVRVAIVTHRRFRLGIPSRLQRDGRRLAAIENGEEARNARQWLERQLPILNGDIRAVLLLNAADKSLRDLAIRRQQDMIMLLAWHVEMLRVHLHNIESDLDNRARRDLILEATGGIPSATIKLVAKMRGSDDPDQVARDWKPPVEP